VVEFTTGSRGEVPGKRKHVTRERHDDDDDDDDDNNNKIHWYSHIPKPVTEH
jgi:hypothetical protein